MRSKVAIYQKISDHENYDQAQRENKKDHSYSGGCSFHASASGGSAGKTRCVPRHEKSNEKRSEHQKHSKPYFHAALSALLQSSPLSTNQGRRRSDPFHVLVVIHAHHQTAAHAHDRQHRN